MLHSGKDLLKTSEDIAQKSREILHLDGIEVGGGGGDRSKFVHKPIRFQSAALLYASVESCI